MTNQSNQCASLFECAQNASRLAESLTGKAQDDAYEIKRQILFVLLEHFPSLLEVAPDPQRPWDMGFKMPGVGRLHVPLTYLRTRKRLRAA